MSRNELVLLILQAYFSNNELRHDFNKGVALSKEIPREAIARIFDFAEAVGAEVERRDQSEG